MATKTQTPPRDANGRFKPRADHRVRNTAFAATAVVGAVAVGIAAAFKFGLLDRLLPKLDTYEDLLIDGRLERDPQQDAVRGTDALRPDPDADQAIGRRDARPFSGVSSEQERELVTGP